MNRREFITLIGSPAAWPFAADAQPSAVPVVGFVHLTSVETNRENLATFRRGLEEILLFVGRAQRGSTTMSEAFARVVQKVERMIADAPIALSVIFVLATLSVLLYYDYNLARKKGFRYPGAICLVAAFWMAALALANAVYSLLPESFQLPENDYLFFSFLILIALLITPAFKLLLQALPTRSVRVYGQRRVRVPFIFLGTVVILVSCVAILNDIPPAIFGIPTGLYMIWLGRRLKSPQAPALLPARHEPIGALYLRSFRREP